MIGMTSKYIVIYMRASLKSLLLKENERHFLNFHFKIFDNQSLLHPIFLAVLKVNGL